MNLERFTFVTEVEDKKVKLVIDFRPMIEEKKCGKFVIENRNVYIPTAYYKVNNNLSSPHWNYTIRILSEGDHIIVEFLNDPKSLAVEYGALNYFKNDRSDILIKGVWIGHLLLFIEFK